MKTYKTWKSAVGTVKKSMETSCFEWFFRNVRQVCDGGFGCRTMYLLTEDSEIWIPSLRSSLWILGAPLPTLSRLRVRMRSRVSVGTRGRPGCPCRTFQVQYQRKPRRCQSMTVSGFTIQECLTPSGPELRQTDPETSIYGFQFRFGSLSLKHNDLVSQGEDLDLEIGPSLEIQTKGSQERKQHREHGARSLRR